MNKEAQNESNCSNTSQLKVTYVLYHISNLHIESFKYCKNKVKFNKISTLSPMLLYNLFSYITYI